MLLVILFGVAHITLMFPTGGAWPTVGGSGEANTPPLYSETATSLLPLCRFLRLGDLFLIIFPQHKKWDGEERGNKNPKPQFNSQIAFITNNKIP